MRPQISGIVNCFNRGEVKCKSGNYTLLRQGGIVGTATSASKISNCYSTGKITGEAIGTDVNIGLAIGKATVKSTVSNVYCVKQGNILAIAKSDTLMSVPVESDMIKSETDMKTKEFVDLLNGQSGTAFVQDVLNKNGGYPVLK